MTDPIRILFTSDLHFGNITIPQEEMAQAFGDTIYPLIADTDIFFINGDFFDTLVVFDSQSFDPIYDVIMSVLRLCEHHGTTLRVMQGTHSHDRAQLKRFAGFYKKGGFTFNFKIIEVIDVEEITVRDRTLRILYTPDDLGVRNTDGAMDLIHARLDQQGWDYVDYACMHGFFDFTFPKMLDASQRVVFRESEFGFVRKMIDVGHVHQFRVVGKVASNGSFDRLVFGDEDPKGCLRVMDYPERYTAQFVENTNAAIFDTLTIPADYDTQDWQTMIRDHLSKRTSSRMRYFRLFLEDFSHRDALRQWVKSEYPDTAFKIEKPKIKDQNAAILPPTSELFTTLERRPAPTPSSIASHVSAWIETEFGQAMSEETVGRYLAIA